MFIEIEIFAFWIVLILAAPEKLWARGNGKGRLRGDHSSKSGMKPAIQCSEVGNCTCLIEKQRVSVQCTSVGDSFDKIASKLPPKTTHL